MELQLDWYTLKQLSDIYNIPWAYVQHYKESGKLKIKYLHYDENDIATLADTPCNDSRRLPSSYIVVLREDAERLAKQYRSESNKDVEQSELLEETNKETAEELCNRLKLEGLTNKEIAKKLKQVFPKISTYKIGVLLPANEGTNIEPDSISKQGRRLLK